MGHAIDNMNCHITKKYLVDSQMGNTSLNAFYNNYKNNSSYRYSYLRDYSYSNKYEFWADLFAYDLTGLNTNYSLRDIRSKAIKQYTNIYKNNKSKWNSIKEQYK